MLIGHKVNTQTKDEFKNTVLVAAGYNQSWLNAVYEAADLSGEDLDFVALSKDVFLDPGASLLTSPSFMLGEILETATPNLLIIPEGERCYMQLLVDPRVHCLIARTALSNGIIAMAAGAQLILSKLAPRFRIPSSQLFFQKNLQPAEFARQMFAS